MRVIGTLAVVGLIGSSMGGEAAAGESQRQLDQAPHDATAARQLAELLHTRNRLLAISESAEVPVLWATQLIDESGQPISGAEVVAYATPRSSVPATELPPGTEIAAPAPEAVAWALSDASGNVTVRLEPSQVANFADESGWVTLTYAIGGNLGSPRLYFDSVFARSRSGLVEDLESSDSAQGLDWLTSDVGYVDAVADLHQEPGMTVADASPATLARAEAKEQPLSMTLDVPLTAATPDATANGLRAKVPSPPLPTDCEVTRTDTLGVRDLSLTRMYLNQLWSSTFVYEDTTTTSVSVQASAFVSGGNFSLSGSLGSVNIFRNTTGLRVRYGVAAPQGTTRGEEVLAPYDFLGQWWKCRRQATTYEYRYVIYPTNPRPDMLPAVAGDNRIRQPRIKSVTVPACSTNDRLVPSSQSFSRASGSSTSSHSAPLSFSVTSPEGIPVQAGITITPSTTVTYTTGATQFWVNAANTARHLCGLRSQYLSGSTDIVAKK